MKQILFWLVVLILLVVRIVSYERTHVSRIPKEWFDSPHTVTGVVTEDPDVGLQSTKFVLGKLGIMITVPNSIIVHYGDEISVDGVVQAPQNFNTDTGREFNYVNYLAVQDIYGTLLTGKLSIVSTGNKSHWLGYLFNVKRGFIDTIKKLFPQPQAGLFAGIIIGEKSLLPSDVLSNFQISGLTHMIVLSGFNITIVALFAMELFAWLGSGYRSRRIAACLIIPIFVMVTGLGGSSLRAGLMSLLVFALQMVTRRASPIRIIWVTFLLLTAYNPRMIMYDPSFHMSFLAFIGLVFLVPIVDEYTESWHELLGLKKLIVETFAIQLFVLPYMMWMSGKFSLLLLVANVLTVPMVSYVMGFGFVATIIGAISFFWGRIISLPINAVLHYFIWVAATIASVSWAIVTIPPFSIWVMVVIYLVMIGTIFFKLKK